ncbi:aminoglycoside phosphotransferase family protein [Cytobacillus solani]|uniref:Aminoglycoside phosphotransferase n=1 Tax=Cytobacillus solani TaxID=1637975 RepID=A0A0Q3VFL3_9BACI|nr:phosphotransferase [Cytobacillus solani]KOP71133.1 aminoglycoside phosphotransferase [Bacillus sp. FJAT-21945]KQL17922.1 aminoglycoside phosphotransferase [Cytobacillus solani]USK55743.1 phosphotransferase [Cytobacillus solani]
MNLLEQLKNRIPSLQTSTMIEQINKGFSNDNKYVVKMADGKKYLLRTAAIDQYERKKSEFNLITDLQNYCIQSPQPIAVGKVEELNLCYYLLSYIEGEDARELLPFYSIQDQYKIGLFAGIDLAKIHAVRAPASIDHWYDRIMKKHQKYVEAYWSCGLKIRGDYEVINFIDKNERLLINRPSRIQHDDFHVGNIIVENRQYAGIIDFNRYDWGDPYHDFLKVGLFSREVSIPFSIGQINGYFNEEIPEDFWTLYSIYLGMSIFSAIVWTIKVVPENLNEMIERIYQILEDHKNFELTKPIWFK